MMECKRCGNKDPEYFYKGHKGIYCRKCIRFSRVLLEEELSSFDYEVSEGIDDYHFSYELTAAQKKASKEVCEYIKDKDVLLHCVCGAGKTEIVVEAISKALSEHKKVAYAISRKEVVIELEKRFRKIFDKAKVISVYGGHHDELSGDLLIMTCHQLYRYYRTFDLLIIDEADAYPLKGNETLINIALSASKGRIIFSTATVDEQLKRVLKKREYKEVSLNVRPSGRPLSVPDIFYLDKISSLVLLYVLLRKIDGQCLVFVPKRKMSENLYYLFRYFFDCRYVYSDYEYRREVIEGFRNNEFPVLFSTSVLERGVTIHNISVIILNYDKYFDESSIIQMLGRVGRGINDDKGSSYIISNRIDKKIPVIIDYLKEANTYL
ncbi:MAG: helicase-related protein [Erysipelotrichaceae bacterium]|nr:helicase-related protein [Erysipelotrichaceae bacterium]